MVKRTVYLSLERRQVYQSLRCLSAQTLCDNVQCSVGSSTGSRASVFLRLGPAHLQKLQIKTTAHCPGTGSVSVSHRDVGLFEHLSDLSTSQDKPSRSRPVTFGTPAFPHGRFARHQNKTISQLVAPERSDQERSNVVEYLRQKIDSLRKMKEERLNLPRHISSMIKSTESCQTAEDVSRIRSALRRMLVKSTETIGQSLAETTDAAACEPSNASPEKLVRTNWKGEEPVYPALRLSSGVHLSSGSPHWQAKSALRHEEFRRAQKWNLLLKRRGIRRCLVTTSRSDEIGMTRREPIITRESFSRKRQAPCVDHLVTLSKRPRMTRGGEH